MSHFFEQSRDIFVGLDCRCAEMPRPTVGLIHPKLGQHAMCPTTLLAHRKLHYGRANERVTERGPVGGLIDICEPYLLGCSEITEPRAPRCAGVQDTNVPRAVQCHEQQQLPRLSRELGDARCEERL
jgi:hypothetical protein